jgi:hypothetical protein
MNYDWTGIRTKRVRVMKSIVIAALLVVLCLIPWLALTV